MSRDDTDDGILHHPARHLYAVAILISAALATPALVTGGVVKPADVLERVTRLETKLDNVSAQLNAAVADRYTAHDASRDMSTLKLRIRRLERIHNLGD